MLCWRIQILADTNLPEPLSQGRPIRVYQAALTLILDVGACLAVQFPNNRLSGGCNELGVGTRRLVSLRSSYRFLGPLNPDDTGHDQEVIEEFAGEVLRPFTLD